MINKERGAITLFTVVICMFLITNVILINIGIMNKNASQEKEITKISDNYEVSQTKMEQAYQEVIESKEYPTYGELLKLLEQEKLKMYPVGSIYISTNSTDPSKFIGGTWERYGKGKTLVGLDENQAEFDTVDETGGQKNITLSEAQLPSHSHSIPALSGSTSAAGKHTHTYSQSSTVTGGTVLDIKQIPNHTHTYEQPSSTTGSHTLTPAEIPSHTHTYEKPNASTNGHILTAAQIPMEVARACVITDDSTWSLGIWGPHGSGYAVTMAHQPGFGSFGQSHSHTISTTSTSTGGTGRGQGHTHSISTTSQPTGDSGGLNKTAQAHTHTISFSNANTSEVAEHTHTVTTNTNTTGTIGSGQAVNVQDPYITVYMWRRIS